MQRMHLGWLTAVVLLLPLALIMMLSATVPQAHAQGGMVLLKA